MEKLVREQKIHISRLEVELENLKDRIVGLEAAWFRQYNRSNENNRLIFIIKGNSDLILLRYHELHRVNVNLLSHFRERQVLLESTVEKLTNKFESLRIAIENVII